MSHSKSSFKNWIIAMLVFAVLISGIVIVFRLTTMQKKPVTAEQICDVLTKQGYQPYDTTESNLKKNPNWGLLKSIAVEDDDLNFYFYSFDSEHENNAVDVYGQAHSLIVRTKNAYPNAEHDTKTANYCIYTLKAKGEYNVAIYVGNTAIYAYCKEENSKKIDSILQEINY